MSKVISFQLSSDNPREAQALKIIETWMDLGYSLRYNLTEAILSLENDDTKSKLVELNTLLKEVALHLDQVRQDGYGVSKLGDRHHTSERLANSFIASIKQAAKPGIRRSN